MEQIFMYLSSYDYLTYRDFCSGTYLRGSTGSGKSGFALKALALAAFRDGLSGLIITTKEGEAQQYAKLAEQVDRGKDVRIVGKGSPHTFNVFSHEAKLTESKVDIPVTLGILAEQFYELFSGGGQEKNGDFFVNSSKMWLGIGFGLQVDAGSSEISLQVANDIITSFPTSPDMPTDTVWANSPCGQFVFKAKEREKAGLMTEEERSEWHSRLKAIDDISVLPPETFGSILATHQTQVSSLLVGSAKNTVLAQNPTLTPEEVFRERLLVILDLPVQKYGFVGQALSKLIKYWFMSARQRFPIQKDEHDNPDIWPFLVLVDEFQLFCSQSQDSRLFGVMRSSGTCFVAATQSDNSLWEVMDSRKVSYQAGSILANLSNKFVLNLSDPFTCEQVANDIGKSYIRKQNVNFGRSFGGQPNSGTGAHVGGSFHEEFLHLLEPLQLTLLNKPSRERLYAECIFYSHGKQFSNNMNFIRLAFSSYGETLAMEGTEAPNASPNGFGLFLREFVGEVSRFALGGFVMVLKLTIGLVRRRFK